ncbi:hypothetical protein [Micromonospora carbonacea]|uniref:hypothetical protein n=1 Tax=Micromonospora carbonacea TaxID=47853 RepID=UPI00114CB289|nr:hypothetical protein [Micromonospora carbonacea]
MPPIAATNRPYAENASQSAGSPGSMAGGWPGRISNSITLLNAYNAHRSSRANATAAILASPTCRNAAKIDEWADTHGSSTSRPHALPP